LLDKMSQSPFVSIIIPCHNEEKYIPECLDSIIANDYPKGRLEILVADGMSEDRTREIIGRYVHQYPFVTVLDNPKRITPAAFNMGIKNAKGEIIMIMSAHATYKSDYISKCVKYLDEYKADNVGGVMKTIPRNNTFVGKALILAISHRFGSGNSYFRIGSKEPRWVDAVPFSTYRKEIFEKIGFFNEKLVRSQDMEFHKRMTHAGGKILLHPEIVSHYYARSDFKSFCKHNFENGVWAIYPLKYTKTLLSFRHMIPLAFVLSLLVFGSLSALSHVFLYCLLLITGLYFVANIYSSTEIAIKERNLAYLLLLPFVFLILHISYGLGSLYGLIKAGVELLAEKLGIKEAG
jgi:cellulose synthase/poly-beta-1,6-N-acetylglucosamine synthase-like glycosyltransferase